MVSCKKIFYNNSVNTEVINICSLIGAINFIHIGFNHYLSQSDFKCHFLATFPVLCQ